MLPSPSKTQGMAFKATFPLPTPLMSGGHPSECVATYKFLMDVFTDTCEGWLSSRVQPNMWAVFSMLDRQ